MVTKTFLFFTLYSSLAFSQSRAGLTGVRDTSYNNAKALSDTRKSYPHLNIYEISIKDTDAVKIQKDISYAQVQERELKLDAFIPTKKTKKLRPAVLIIHGGGWRTGNKSQHHALAQKLALSGYVCFTPEYRLSTEALYPAAVHDLKAALRWMRANARTYNIDTNRIATLGFSAGGQLSALLGNTGDLPLLEGNVGVLGHSSRVKAIVDIDGILAFIHPDSGEGDDSKRTSAATNWFGYSKIEKPEIWNEASALSYAGKNSPPTLFLNSSVERMHAGRAEYCQKLALFGIYTEVHTFDDSPHSFCLFEPWFDSTVKFIKAFLDKKL